MSADEIGREAPEMVKPYTWAQWCADCERVFRWMDGEDDAALDSRTGADQAGERR